MNSRQKKAPQCRAVVLFFDDIQVKDYDKAPDNQGPCDGGVNHDVNSIDISAKWFIISSVV